jgi:hypothetical protein
MHLGSAPLLPALIVLVLTKKVQKRRVIEISFFIKRHMKAVKEQMSKAVRSGTVV